MIELFPSENPFFLFINDKFNILYLVCFITDIFYDRIRGKSRECYSFIFKVKDCVDFSRHEFVFLCKENKRDEKNFNFFFKVGEILDNKYFNLVYIYIYEINASQNKKENFSCKKAKIGKKDKES